MVNIKFCKQLFPLFNLTKLKTSVIFDCGKISVFITRMSEKQQINIGATFLVRFKVTCKKSSESELKQKKAM